jgi:hypothetical protein
MSDSRARKAEGILFGSGQWHFLRVGVEQLERCPCMRVAAIKVNQLPPPMLEEARVFSGSGYFS